MPPANLTDMQPEERAQIMRWFREVGAFGVAGL